MTYRTVTISGYPEGIANGVMLIQRIMEDRYNEVDNIEFESPPLNVMTTQTNVKIVLPDYIVDNICSKRHGTPFIEIIKNKYNISTKLGKEPKNRHLDKNDLVDDSHPKTVEILEFADSSVNLAVRCFVKNGDYWTAYWQIYRAVKYALDENNISIPYPHTEMIINNNNNDKAVQDA